MVGLEIEPWVISTCHWLDVVNHCSRHDTSFGLALTVLRHRRILWSVTTERMEQQEPRTIAFPTWSAIPSLTRRSALPVIRLRALLRAGRTVAGPRQRRTARCGTWLQRGVRHYRFARLRPDAAPSFIACAIARLIAFWSRFACFATSLLSAAGANFISGFETDPALPANLLAGSHHTTMLG